MADMKRSGRRAIVGKVVLVTGASSGIGETTALEFGRAGAAVVLGAPGPDRAELRLEDLPVEFGSFRAADIDPNSPFLGASAWTHGARSGSFIYPVLISSLGLPLGTPVRQIGRAHV